MLVLRTTRCLVGSLKCLSEVIHQILSMCSVKAVRIMVPIVSLEVAGVRNSSAVVTGAEM
jgi:hypothetical protein